MNTELSFHSIKGAIVEIAFVKRDADDDEEKDNLLRSIKKVKMISGDSCRGAEDKQRDGKITRG